MIATNLWAIVSELLKQLRTEGYVHWADCQNRIQIK
jgi:hypothetical protein